MDFVSSLRYSARSFARTPGLTLALLFSVALGIGSNAVVYGFVRGLIASALATAGGAGEGDGSSSGAITPEIAESLERVGTLLRIAAGAVFFVACANVGAFLLARASARSRESAVRVALGASRARLASQLLGDSVVISVAGGAAGVLLAIWTSNILPALFFSQDAEHLVFAPDRMAVATASAAGVAITIACGLLPLFEMRHDRPATVLQRESAGPSQLTRRVRTGLVLAQMTCCSVLVISSSLLFQSFRSALQTSTGYRLGQPILATLHVRPDSNSRHEALAIASKYFREAESAGRSVAGILSSAWVATLPGGAPTLQSVRIELPQTATREVSMTVAAFTPYSLTLVSTPPLAGRLFGGEDTPETCRVAVVNKEAADAHFNGDAVGQAIEDREGQRVEIVGVVAMRHTEAGATTYDPRIFLYPNQDSTLTDRIGPAQFRISTPSSATAVLETNVVSRSFFDLMRLPAVAGNLFQDDLDPAGCSVGVVNTEAAERYFEGNPVGASIIDSSGRRIRIVGVVQSPALLTLQRRVEPTIYFPMTQNLLPRMALLLGTAQADRATLGTVRRRLEAVRGAFRPPAVATLDQHLRQTALAPLRIATTLIGASGMIAVALGVLGLYGAMSEAARQRRRETAVRIALGSQSWRVRRDVLADGARLAGAGAAMGMLGAIVVARILARLSPGGEAITVWAWLSAPLVLTALVALAGLIPARRALMVDPLRTIRGDS